LHLFLPVHVLPRADLQGLAAGYWSSLRRHGRDPAAHELGLLLPVHVAATTEQARAQARPGFLDYYRVIHALRADYLQWPARRSDEGPPPAARAPMTFERLCAEAAVLGDPPTTVAGLRRVIEETGATEILCWMNMGSIPHEPVLRSME